MIFDNWRQWLNQTFRPWQQRRTPIYRATALRFRPSLEHLESRLAPSTTTVTSIAGTTPPAGFTNASSVTYLITFADVTTGLQASNLSLTGTAGIADANIGVPTMADGGLDWSDTISGLASANGTLILNLANDAGLSNTVSNTPFPGDSYTLDTTPPTILIGAPSQAFARSGDTVTYPVTYTDANFAVSNLSAADVHLSPADTATGTLGADFGTGANRTISITGITGEGTLSISIDAGSATDQAGNQADASGLSTAFTVENTSPTASALASSQTYFAPENSSAALNTTTFTSNVTDANPVNWTLTITDSNNATVRTFIGTGNVSQIWNGETSSAAFVADGVYTATLTYTDQAGNAGTPTSTTVTVDNTLPTVTIGSPSVSFANSSATVTYGLTFSDANFNASSTNATTIKSDLTFNTSAGVTIPPADVNVTGSGVSYTVSITGVTGDGTAGISLTAGVAADFAGNETAATGPSAAFTVDNTKPAVSIGAAKKTLVSGALQITYTITYADTNFDHSTLAVSNVTLDKTGTATATVNVDALTGATRTVTLTNVSGSGTLGITLATGTAVDKAGNLAAAPTGPSATVAVKAPAFTNASKAAITTGTALTFQLKATGTPTAITFSLTGAPSWLSINSTNQLVGTPPAASVSTPYDFTIKAVNGVSADATQAFVLTVNPGIAFKPTALAAYTVDVAYSQTITVAGGTGKKTITYVLSGPLPKGLKITPASPTTGAITIRGVPTAIGDVTITLKATDTVGAVANITYTLAGVQDIRRRGGA